jgi:hypothetical protein
MSIVLSINFLIDALQEAVKLINDLTGFINGLGGGGTTQNNTLNQTNNITGVSSPTGVANQISLSSSSLKKQFGSLAGVK